MIFWGKPKVIMQGSESRGGFTYEFLLLSLAVEDQEDMPFWYRQIQLYLLQLLLLLLFLRGG